MATQWVILVSIMSLAFSVAVGEDKAHSEVPQATSEGPKPNKSTIATCCDSSRMAPEGFIEEPPNCSDTLNGETGDAVYCNTVVCVLKENKLLKEDDSMDEQKMRELFVEKGKSEVKSIWEAALNKCLAPEFKRSEKFGCKSEAANRFLCTAQAAVQECPIAFLDTTKPDCKHLEEGAEDDTKEAIEKKTEVAAEANTEEAAEKKTEK